MRCPVRLTLHYNVAAVLAKDLTADGEAEVRSPLGALVRRTV